MPNLISYQSDKDVELPRISCTRIFRKNIHKEEHKDQQFYGFIINIPDKKTEDSYLLSSFVPPPTTVHQATHGSHVNFVTSLTT
ncbi:hypothetical protein CEXT_268781 [Caerostris extrusa]|uniref:Uncharacterized protein n=1 Tax=Caerostris extrusa TaxID=172846 RepID=A0AAV4Q4V2_CAEEX|nr:hypothetical protein CEXT_268781 [Caerostris extrusa]